MKMTHLCVHRRVATSALALAATVLGLYSLVQMPVNFLPELTYPFVRVDIRWPGATPDEVVTNIAEVVERRVATVDGLDYMSSESREGRYQLEINFDYGIDPDVAHQDALAAMSRAAPQLPDDVEQPVVHKADPSQLPVVHMPISSTRWDMVTLRSWAERWLQDQVIAVGGVGNTEVVGGLERQIRVHLDPEAMAKRALSVDDIINRVGEENVQQFAGRVTVGPREFITRTDGEFTSVEDIANVVLARDGPRRVQLKDVADVRDHHDPARIVTRFNGEAGVRLTVNKQAEANTVEVVRAVKRRMAELEPSLPDHIHIGYMEDQAEYVTTALSGVRNVVIVAAVLVILVVYLFLGSFRQVLVMVAVLPVILIASFTLMWLGGFSLNIFSLGGLVVAVGVVLDNSTVVLENITRRHELDPLAPPAQTAVEGTRQVGPPIIAATLAYMALFVPFLLVPGLASLLLRELILVIAAIVVISLLAAVTWTPMLTVSLVRPRPADAGPTRFQRAFGAVTRAYGAILEKVLRPGWRNESKAAGRGVPGPRWLLLVAFLAIAAGGFWMGPHLGFEFLPSVDDGRITVRINMPTGTSVQQSDQLVRRVEAALEDEPWIESLFALSGGRSRGLFTQEQANQGEIEIQLVPRSDRPNTRAVVNRLRQQLGEIQAPGATIQVRPARMRGVRAGAAGPSDLAVRVQGPDVATLYEQAQKTAELMRGREYLSNVDVSIDMDRPEFQVIIDRSRAAELGLSISNVARSLRTLIDGTVATRYKEDDEHYDVRVVVPETHLTSRADVADLLLDRPGGGKLRLHEVAHVRQATGPVEIARENQTNQVVVSGDAAGVSLGQALSRLEADLETVSLPAGYRFDLGGQAELMLDMQRTMFVILAMAVFFAFIIMAVQFNRIKLPLLILATLPASIAGMVFALHVTGLELGATVFIALLVVVAATINDGVLLLNFAEDIRREKHVPPWDAVIEAAGIRLRPRIMTSISIIAGLLPLALNIDAGGDMLQPMAIAAIGGLLMEILAALFLMPCLYILTTHDTSPLPLSR